MSRIDKLKQKLAARDGKPGYEKNCEALREEISRLEVLTKGEKQNESIVQHASGVESDGR